VTITTILIVLYLAPSIFLAIIAVGPVGYFGKFGFMGACVCALLIGLFWPLALYGAIRGFLIDRQTTGGGKP
jgi:hypothetical protein